MLDAIKPPPPAARRAHLVLVQSKERQQVDVRVVPDIVRRRMVQTNVLVPPIGGRNAVKNGHRQISKRAVDPLPSGHAVMRGVVPGHADAECAVSGYQERDDPQPQHIAGHEYGDAAEHDAEVEGENRKRQDRRLPVQRLAPDLRPQLRQRLKLVSSRLQSRHFRRPPLRRRARAYPPPATIAVASRPRLIRAGKAWRRSSGHWRPAPDTPPPPTQSRPRCSR